MKKNQWGYIILFVVFICLLFALYGETGDDWLHTRGSQILDQNENPVRITGINWFGYDTSQCVFHGLWSRDLQSVLDQVASLGFNAIRVPLHAALAAKWSAGTEVYTQGVTIINAGTSQVNTYLEGLDTLEILDYTIAYCGRIGLKIILDMHSLNPDDNAYNLWYSDTFTIAGFINTWKFLVNRYKDNDTVIAVDLKNEPHGLITTGGAQAAKWDDTADPNNWHNAAQTIGLEILAINPNLLILVEGVQEYYDPAAASLYAKLGLEQPAGVDSALHTGWWGGNLMGAGSFPVNLGSFNHKLVYAPHEYGPSVYNHPWFFSGFNRSSMEIVWEHFWSFIHKSGTAPVLIGEWGGKIADAENAANLIWMTALRDYIIEQDLNHTFWCLNENSPDTGGIITGSQWESVDQGKYEFIKKTLWQDADGKFIGLDHTLNLLNWTNVGAYYGNRQTPTPTQPATPSPAYTKKGDVNNDGIVNIIDALMTAQYYVGLNPPAFSITAADVNNDGAVNIIDALMIAQYYVGLITLDSRV